MSYEVSYIDGLQGTWVAQPTPTVSAPIVPYSTGRDGGFAYQAPRQYQPPVGSPTAVLDRALDAETYVTPTGARAWRPTAAEDALVDAVTQNPYSGLDELVEAGGRGAAGKGIQNLPYVGDVVGGAVEGASVYGRTGSVTHGVFAGAGSSIGGVAGTAIGASIGAVGGPVGIAVGGIVGGALGSAFGSAAGQALAGLISPLPPANVTGAQSDTGIKPFSGGQLAVNYRVTYEYNSILVSGDTGSLSTQTAGGSVGFRGPIQGIKGDGLPAFQSIVLLHNGQESGIRGGNCAQGCYRNIKIVSVTRVDGLPDTGGDPSNLTEPFKPTIPIPVIPRTPGFRLPIPRLRGRRGPTENPSTGPIGVPFGLPKPITGIPTLPRITAPGDYPRVGPHDDPYPDGDPTNPNPVGGPGPGAEPCDPCVELRAIRAKLDETFSLAWSLPDCGTDFPIIRAGAIEGQGLAGLSQQINGLYQVLKVLHENTRCSNDALAIPETWNLKKSIEVPQMIIVTKMVGDSNPTYRRSFTIPHPRYKLMKDISRIKRFKYKRGSCQATIQLPDNSKCVINASTPAEAKRASKYVLQLMDQGWARSAEIKITEKISMDIIPATVEFHVAKYFATSDDSLLPVWSLQIP